MENRFAQRLQVIDLEMRKDMRRVLAEATDNDLHRAATGAIGRLAQVVASEMLEERKDGQRSTPAG